MHNDVTPVYKPPLLTQCCQSIVNNQPAALEGECTNPPYWHNAASPAVSRLLTWFAASWVMAQLCCYFILLPRGTRVFVILFFLLASSVWSKLELFVVLAWVACGVLLASPPFGYTQLMWGQWRGPFQSLPYANYGSPFQSLAYANYGTN
jgi:hypothetical protein